MSRIELVFFIEHLPKEVKRYGKKESKEKSKEKNW
jgi:hypothetical protein